MFKKESLRILLKLWDKGGFTVHFWDGSEENYGNSPPQFKLVFTKEPNFGAKDLKQSPDVVLGTAYMDGVIDLDGNMDDVVRTMFASTTEAPRTFPLKKLRQELLEKEKKQELKSIQSHYDRGNDFFSLWLDPTMTYSCAYFENENDTLEEAQHHKIDLSLRKLDLHPGEQLLDIGCGWGELILEAAARYDVHALGITLSQAQYDAVQEKIHARGLEGKVDVQLANYLDLDPDTQQFDKIISIGMFEHVGKKQLPLYMSQASRLLKDSGLFLLHFITSRDETESDNWLKQYIFPKGYLPSVRETVDLFPDFGFRLIHFESLRRHYARTLTCWYNNFKANQDKMGEKYDERFKRMWRLYLAGCSSAFRIGAIDVAQFLLSKGISNDFPMTNAFMYKK